MLRKSLTGLLKLVASEKSALVGDLTKATLRVKKTDERDNESNIMNVILFIILFMYMNCIVMIN